MEVTLDQGLERFEGLSHAEKNIPGMCESKHNGSEAREYLMCWRETQEPRVAGIEQIRRFESI